MVINSDWLLKHHVYEKYISVVLLKKHPTTATKYSAKFHTKYRHKKEEASK